MLLADLGEYHRLIDMIELEANYKKAAIVCFKSLYTLTSALISSSVSFSCCRDSKNLVNVARVITCDFEVSTPEQLLTMLAAATASKTCFF